MVRIYTKPKLRGEVAGSEDAQGPRDVILVDNRVPAQDDVDDMAQGSEIADHEDLLDAEQECFDISGELHRCFAERMPGLHRMVRQFPGAATCMKNVIVYLIFFLAFSLVSLVGHGP